MIYTVKRLSAGFGEVTVMCDTEGLDLAEAVFSRTVQAANYGERVTLTRRVDHLDTEETLRTRVM